MRFILSLFLLCALFVSVQAQVKRVVIQASGLTCSLCSNAINKSLRTLSFVKEVEPNIQNSTFEVSFNENVLVNFDDMKKKVEDAGFFVAGMTVDANVDSADIANDIHLEQFGTLFHFLNVAPQTIHGNVTFRLLDKGFVSAREYKRNAKYTQMACYKTGMMGNCCKGIKGNQSARIYHVTL